MKKSFKLFLLAAVALPMVMLTSCFGTPEPPKPEDQQLSTFVTYEGQNATSMLFSTYRYQGAPKVSLTAAIIPAFAKLEPGTRLLLMYTNSVANPFESGPINIVNALEAYTDTVEVAPKSEISTLNQHPAYVGYCNLEGGYFDIVLEAPVAQKQRTFNIYIDENTVNEEFPDAYLCFVSDSEMSSNKTLFASIDMTPMLGRSTCKGFRLHFMTATTRRYVQVFNTDGTAPGMPVEENYQ